MSTHGANSLSPYLNLQINSVTDGHHSELIRLFDLCKNVHRLPGGWEHVRLWLNQLSRSDVQDAALVQVEPTKQTPLHLVCLDGGPLDIVERILDAAPIAAQLCDFKERLPLHYAAESGTDDRVLQVLVAAYPPGTYAGDNENLVPLHVALKTNGNILTTSCARILSAGGANSCRDGPGGMLPLHYACAYGSSVDVLEILKEANGELLDLAKDSRGLIPLHYVCANPYRATSPDATTFLLELSPLSVNIRDGTSSIPLCSLAARASSGNPTAHTYEENPSRILDLYLKAKPTPTAGFLTALQSLPEWLRDRAVITPYVQETLNRKIAMRLPTAMLLGDFICYVSILISFSIGVKCTIDNRMLVGETCEGTAYIWVLLASTIYFLLREVIQVISLLSLGRIKSYFGGGANYIDILTIMMGFYFFFDMRLTDGIGVECLGDPICSRQKLRFFRVLASVTLLLFWVAMLSFLKRFFIDFAVFVGGLRNVVIRFLPFLTVLFIILLTFSKIFVLIYFDSKNCECTQVPCEYDYPDLINEFRPFCDEMDSLLKVYTMLLGEVDDENFLIQGSDETFAQNMGVVFFVFFMFLVVILLANVLIAVVTDSYGVIKNERAAIVFWTNRLDYVSECDGIIHGPWKNRIRQLFLLTPKSAYHVDEDGFGYEQVGAKLWNKLVRTPNGWKEHSIWTIYYWIYFIIQIFSIVLVFCWFSLGLLTLGILWPPQVRKSLFSSSIKKGGRGEQKELEQRSIEVRSLREEVKDLQDEILLEMTSDRREVVAMKAQFRDMKHSLQNEMKDIKETVTLLFELQSREF